MPEKSPEAPRLGLTELVDKESESGMLAGALARGRLGGTLLLFGPDGSGKSSLAFWLAAALNCTAGQGTGAPCGRCNSCRKIEKLSHPDVIWSPPLPGAFYKSGRLDEERLAEVFAEKRKAPWLDVRSPDKTEHHLPAVARIRSEAEKSCYEGRCKVFIVTAAERLRQEAANAFLKLLEEPRPNLTLILCSERPSGLLPTILSRCQRLRIRRPGQAAAVELMGSRFGLESAAARELLALADGNLSQALRLMDQESVDRQRDWVDSAFAAALAGDMELAFRFLDDRAGPLYNRGDFERFAAFLAQGLREALLLTLGGRAADGAGVVKNPSLLEYSERTDNPGTLIRLLDRLLSLSDDLGRNVNLKLLGWSILYSMRKAVGTEHGNH